MNTAHASQRAHGRNESPTEQQHERKRRHDEHAGRSHHRERAAREPDEQRAPPIGRSSATRSA